MAFDYVFYKNKMSKVENFCEDKELELKILKEGIKIQYAEDAIVYDEKVQNVSIYKNQRMRWLAGQFDCLNKYFFSALYELLFKANVDFFNKVIQTTFLPRIISLGILCIEIIGSILTNNLFHFNLAAMSILFFLIPFLLSVPAYLSTKISLRDLSKLASLSIALILT